MTDKINDDNELKTHLHRVVQELVQDLDNYESLTILGIKKNGVDHANCVGDLRGLRLIMAGLVQELGAELERIECEEAGLAPAVAIQ